MRIARAASSVRLTGAFGFAGNTPVMSLPFDSTRVLPKATPRGMSICTDTSPPLTNSGLAIHRPENNFRQD